MTERLEGAGGKEVVTRGVRKYAKRNQEQGVAVLLVEQNAYLALQVAHRGYVLETGCMVLADSAAHLRENPRVKAAYLGG